MGGVALAAGGAAADRQPLPQDPMQPLAINVSDADVEIVGQGVQGAAIALDVAEGLQPLPEPIPQGGQP